MTRRSLPFVAMPAVVLALSTVSAWVQAGEFAQFRGPGGSAVVPDQDIPLQWSETENLAWRQEIPGSGWSQPVVFGELLFVTAAVSEKDVRPKDFDDGVKLPQSMGLGGLTRAPKVQIEWQVLCLKTSTGEIVWTKTVTAGEPKYPVHPSNTYATESPVVDANGVYVFFGATGTVAGLSHAGDLKWQQELGAFPTNNGFGTGSSLAIHGDLVFVQHLTEKSSLVAGLSAASGDIVWSHERQKKSSSWSSPIVWTNGDRTELLVSGGSEVNSFDPATGHTLWTLRNVKAATACSLALDEKRIYFGGSDPFSKGPLFAVSSGGDGDISPKDENKKFEHCDWLVEKAGPGMASPVSTGRFVYVSDNNILRCYDAATGERVYQSRIPNLDKVAASPLVVGDKLVVLDEHGAAAVIRTGPEFKVLGSGSIDDTFWSTPAVSDGSIYLRGVKALYCVRKPR